MIARKKFLYRIYHTKTHNYLKLLCIDRTKVERYLSDHKDTTSDTRLQLGGRENDGHIRRISSTVAVAGGGQKRST